MDRQILATDSVNDLCLVEGFKDEGIKEVASAQKYDKIYYYGFPGTSTLGTFSDGYVTGDLKQKITIFEITNFGTFQQCLIEGGSTITNNEHRTFCNAEYDLVRTTLQSYMGASGSPVINSYGQLLGVVKSIHQTNLEMSFVRSERLLELISTYERSK